MKKKNVSRLMLSLFFAAACLICLYPLWYGIMTSIATYHEYVDNNLKLWIFEPTLAAYRYIFASGRLAAPLFVTVFITVVGTAINVFLITLVAYGLSKDFPGKKAIMVLIVITMYIQPGLVPNYMLLRSLKLLNNHFVHILPVCINTFYLIIVRTYFASFSRELEEAAQIDGCNAFSVFMRVVLPVSKPIIFTILLFSAVDYWNTFSSSVYYISIPGMKTLQDFLYGVISGTSSSSPGTGLSIITTESGKQIFSETIKMAYTAVSVLPIIIIYPCVQKHITTGLMTGSVKG